MASGMFEQTTSSTPSISKPTPSTGSAELPFGGTKDALFLHPRILWREFLREEGLDTKRNTLQMQALQRQTCREHPIPKTAGMLIACRPFLFREGKSYQP